MSERRTGDVRTLSRRMFLKAGGAALVIGTLPSMGCGAAGALPAGLICSATDDGVGRHRFSVLDLEGGKGFDIPLPIRGHACTVRPGAELGHLILVARRPGTTLFVVDVSSGQELYRIGSTVGRHFLGHAVYSGDGRTLYVVENCFDDSPSPDLTPQDSVIGVYDAENGYRRVREFSTHGVGAHQLLLGGDGQTLKIANGGIYTHPSVPRGDLNIDTMSPSLVEVEIASGGLLARHTLDRPQLGIRHIAQSKTGTVVLGTQISGDVDSSQIPLVYAQRPGEGLEALAAPRTGWAIFEQYIASVAVHPTANVVAASSPRGGLVGFWTLEDGRYLGAVKVPDCAGVAVLEDSFIVTSGNGTVVAVHATERTKLGQLVVADTRWDNHCTAIAFL